MATLRHRSNGWQAQVIRKGWPRQYATFDTKAEAEKWARQIEGDMDRGLFVSRHEAEATTLDEAFERYRREVTVHKKSASQEEQRIRQWRARPLAARMVATIRSVDIARFRDERLKDVSPASVRLELALLSHVFTIARKEWGMADLRNPVQDVTLPAKARSRERRLQPGEEARLLSAAGMYQEMPEIITFAIETAMRRGEIMGLRWADIDLDGHVAHLNDTKSGDARDVPLSTVAMGVLRRLPRQIDGRVFHLSRAFVSTGFARVCQSAGIEGLRFHDLRHEATSRLFEKGFNPMEVSAITGQKTLEMLKRYTHLRAKDLLQRLG